MSTENDLTTLTGLCNEIDERAEVIAAQEAGGYSVESVAWSKRMAERELMADIFKRLEALERSPDSRLPPVERHQAEGE